MKRLLPKITWLSPWLLAAAFLVVWANPAHADHVPPGVLVIHMHQPPYLDRPPGSGPFSQSDINDALELAKLGDAEAQANLGIMLQSRGDYKQAAYWYQQAANAGVANAEYNMGTLFFNGEGVAQDYAKAHEWFAHAARRGNKYAEFQLGMTYFTGQGVNRDPNQEIFWYEKAARHGLPAAAYNLGVIYNNGEEVPPDYVRAYAWLLLAQKGGLDANSALTAVAQNMTPGDIQKAKDLSKSLGSDPQVQIRE